MATFVIFKGMFENVTSTDLSNMTGGVCVQMVPGAGDHVELEGLHQVHRHLVRRLHPRRDAL